MSGKKRGEERPRVAIGRVWTGRGDRGETDLAGGGRTPKDSLRIEACGAIDELNSFVGMARLSAVETAEHPELALLAEELLRVQHQLFNLGAELARAPEAERPAKAPVGERETAWLESRMDSLGAQLKPLRSFVLPGGCEVEARLQVCRTVCRRAERTLVKLSREEEAPESAQLFLNRLSDAFFVWGRYAALALGAPETLWEPGPGQPPAADEGE